MAVYGGFRGDETLREQRDPRQNTTTLSGDLFENDGPGFIERWDNTQHVVVIRGAGHTTVLDGFSSCASGVPVKLQMKGQGGGFKNVNSGTTKPNGSYNLGSVTAGERYRVIAKTFTTPSGDKCLKDASPTVRASSCASPRS